ERLNLLRNGVELEDGKTAPAEVNIVRQEKHRTVVEITIHEGKNRQVRRMFKAVKNPVLELKRINVGGLTLKGVGSGEIRSLTDEEVQKLTQRLGMHRSGKA
ncbi:MAG: pseudouridine synthase, partial [Peptococcaceae bacterium]|nr:pseudouridine synthase [Peptococcaceae bacterium]